MAHHDDQGESIPVIEGTLGAWMHAYRDLNPGSRELVAERFGLGTATIKRIERGNPVHPNTLRQIAKALFPNDQPQHSRFVRHFLEPAPAPPAATPPPHAAPEVAPLPHGVLPPRPHRCVGRESDAAAVREQLVKTLDTQPPPALIVYGWPGVGKTTLTAQLAYDPQLARQFPDGVLWAALGPTPEPLDMLRVWGRAQGVDKIDQAGSAAEAASMLRSALYARRCLIMVDDLWDASLDGLFNVGGPACARLISTRLPQVMMALARTPGSGYHLRPLAAGEALALLREIVPAVVDRHAPAASALVAALEHLPLAISVAGHLLREEANLGADIPTLLAELQDCAQVLSEPLPADLQAPGSGGLPTVTALLQTSTDRLGEPLRGCFAALGTFAAKPATFDRAALAALWDLDDPMPVIRTLTQRGLIEPTGDGVFYTHALLAAHARGMWREYFA